MSVPGPTKESLQGASSICLLLGVFWVVVVAALGGLLVGLGCLLVFILGIFAGYASAAKDQERFQ